MLEITPGKCILLDVVSFGYYYAVIGKVCLSQALGAEVGKTFVMAACEEAM